MILYKQYELIKSSRSILLDFCGTLPAEVFLNSPDHLQVKSIRELLVHIANTYQRWLENFIHQKKFPFIRIEAVNNVEDIRQFFDRIDNVTFDFINRYKSNPEVLIHGKLPGETELIGITPLKLFTHTITHEFHHKGQIMAIVRQYGYIPPDADIIRFN